MIEPVKLNANVQFKGELDNAVNEQPKQELSNNLNEANLEKTPKTDVVEVQDNSQAQVAEKTSLKEKFNNFKKATTGILKDFNTVTNTSGGFIRGIADGAIIGSVVGLIGKNIKNADGKILGTLKGIGSDCWSGLGKAVKSLPKVWTQAPKDNIKGILSLPSKYYTQYLKGNKVIGALATVAGVGVLALRTVQGKMTANMKNANVDHATNLGHVQ